MPGGRFGSILLLRLLTVRRLQREEISDQITLFLFCQAELHTAVIVLDDVDQSGEPAVVIEPSLLVREESAQRRGPVHFSRRAIGLKIVDADVSALVQIHARLRPERLRMTAVALRFPAEELVAALRGKV